MDLICTGINSIKIYLDRWGSAVRQYTERKIELDTETFTQPRCMSWSHNGSDDGFSIRNISYFFSEIGWLSRPSCKILYFFYKLLPTRRFHLFFCPKLEPITSLNRIPLALIIAPCSCYLQGSVPASADILKTHQAGGNRKWLLFRLLLCPWYLLMTLSLLVICRFRWLLGLCEVQWGESAIYRRTQPCHLNYNRSFCKDWLQRPQPLWKQPMLGWTDVCQPVVHIPVRPARWLCL